MNTHSKAFEDYLDRDGLRRSVTQARGQGVRVGLLDTGVASMHPALEGCIAANYEAVDEGGSVHILPRTEGTDHQTHGTGVAGILHAMAPAAEIHSVCVLGESKKCTLKKLIAGLGFAIQQGWEVVNISLGTLIESQELFDLTEIALYRGQILIAAKDNHPDQHGYPAAFSTVIGVDMEHFPDPMEFIYRPGERIEVLASGIYVDAPQAGGGRFAYTGTSFACPQIAGLAARCREVFPEMNARQFRSILAALSKGETEAPLNEESYTI